jgi:excinuclease ABC subunit C
VIYVGKASSLRQRLSNYFQDPRSLPPRTAAMVAAADSVEWTLVRNEVEAIMLEYSLIKQHRPRFNIRLRDDKSYPFLAITLDDEWPRAMVVRGRKRKGVRYFGPYAHAYAIRDTLDLLLRTFPIRTCSPAKFRQHERLGRPCLLYHIEKCSGPCVGEIDAAEYERLVQELIDFLDGDTDEIVRRLETEMRAAAAELDFERAARLRDRLAAVQRAIEKQQMVADRSEDLDVIGVAEDELEAAVQVFYVRKGRVVGRKGFIVDKVEEVGPGGLVARVLEALYGEEPPSGVPKQVLVPVEPDDVATYEEWLAHLRGSRVRVQVSDYVGSMVVFEDGLPKKSDYRRFKVRGVPGNDDFAAMEEVLTRRLTSYLEHRGERAAKFAYPPQLLLVDGGKGQLNVAQRVVHELGLEDEVPVASLAKRFEEVYVPGRADAVDVPRGSEALYLLQRLRDEAHRFANTFHREVRGKRMTTSALDGIAGLGEVRRKRLVRELGGVNAVKRASLQDLQALPWLPDVVAESVYAALHR